MSRRFYILKSCIFLFASNSLFALTTLHVTQDTDNIPGDIGEPGDLRYCLNTMNRDLNTIPDDYAIVFDFPMTIFLNGILPIINNTSNPVNITIGNSGSTPTVTIDGNNGAYSGFFVRIGNVIIQNINFQNLTAKGGNGGDGISGGGGGMGAGGAVYVPRSFLDSSGVSLILMNVLVNNCSAVGGNGGSYFNLSSTGNEGGGGGGGFAGDGGSILTTGSTGGAGGGGFGGDGGNVTLAIDNLGGGGGGGGGLGSRATIGTPVNLGNGGIDEDVGQDGSGYDLPITAGSGGAGFIGGNYAGGGGGGGSGGSLAPGGGGGGSNGTNGMQAQGNIPPGGGVSPSGGNGGDGGGGGGGGVVVTDTTNAIDGRAGSGGYGGGGGGGAGTGSYDNSYTVQGGDGGVGGGGGGGGVNQSGTTSANGGASSGGGGGGGGGPSDGLGGSDVGKLGGGSGGDGANSVGPGSGGGGGGGGSGIGGAIFVDTNITLTLQALSGTPTVFNTSNTTAQGGSAGMGGGGGGNGTDGSSLGNSIFLREGSTLTLQAQDENDLLTLGEDVSFVDDTMFGGGGTSVLVQGNGTVIYNGTTDYEGNIMINNANFKVNGIISTAPISVCRNISISQERGTLSGIGSLTGTVFVNSGTISPDAGGTLTLGSLTLSPEDPMSNTLGSLVDIEIDSNGTSLVSVVGPASLAGILEIDLDPSAAPGTYTLLTSSGITGTFDSVVFTGTTPNYSLSYLPLGSPTFVQLEFFGYPPSLSPPSNFRGEQRKNDFGLAYELYNQMTWSLSPSPGVAGYFIYRNGQKIATLGASASTYQDHNRQKTLSYTYAITAFNSEGDESAPINITISP